MERKDNFAFEQLLQIAYYKLLQYSKDVLFVAGNRFYDFIITSKHSPSQFAVKVFQYDTQDEGEASNFYNLIENECKVAKQLLLPVSILYVDSQTGNAYFQELLKWNYDIPVILNPLTEAKVVWNETNAKIIFAELDKVICVLPQDMWSFRKTIKIIDDSFLEAYLVYFRIFSDNYSMAEKPKMSEVENFMQYLNGIPETDYPSDDLDKWILAAVKTQYPNSTVRTSTFILNTELRDLRLYNGMKRKKGKVSMMPKSEEIYDFYKVHSDGVLQGVVVDMAYVSDIEFNPDGVICQHYIEEMSIQKMLEIEKLFSTYKPLSDFMKK